MARPIGTGSNLVDNFHVKLTPDEKTEFLDLCDKHGFAGSRLIRNYINAFIETYRDKEISTSTNLPAIVRVKNKKRP